MPQESWEISPTFNSVSEESGSHHKLNVPAPFPLASAPRPTCSSGCWASCGRTEPAPSRSSRSSRGSTRVSDSRPLVSMWRGRNNVESLHEARLHLISSGLQWSCEEEVTQFFDQNVWSMAEESSLLWCLQFSLSFVFFGFIISSTSPLWRSWTTLSV